jgi:hypothetical protein
MQEGTVKVHVRNIMKKLRVGDRTHATLVTNRMLNYPQSASEAGSSSLVEERLAFLKTELRITDAQTALWDTFADAVRNSTDAIAVLHSGIGGGQPAGLTERLARREMDMLARVDALRQWKTVVEPLYAGLNEEQKRGAGQLLMQLFGV